MAEEKIISIKDIPKEKLLAFLAMVVGMFMAILDIQIVASSLSVIASGLSASSDELSWIQTSYIIAEVIIIPVTGFAARLLSTRVFYFISAAGFTIMSVLCSLAWNIESMIAFRALQGLFGGAMIPIAFGSVFIIFPKNLHSTVTIFIGLVVTVAPTMGPTLGGYITEHVSWEFMFLINVVPGIFVCVVIYLYGHFDKPNYSLLNNFDYTGICIMTLSLGSIQYILEEGNKKDWFDSILILSLTIFVIFGMLFFIFWELKHKNPIVDLRAFKNKNFTIGCIYSFILGVGLYGSVYLVPLFLFSIAGFNTYQIGITMVITGVFQFVSAPLAGKMFDSGIDKRFMLAIGFLTFGLGCYLNSFLNAESRYYEFFVPQMVRGLALMFCFMPINDLALGTMSKEEVQNASGLYNLTRNLGGAIGIAVMTTIITSGAKIYTQILKENITFTSPFVQAMQHSVSNSMSGKLLFPDQAAIFLLQSQINREAFIMSINNVFVITSLIFCAGVLLIPFMSDASNKNTEMAH